MKEKEYFAWLNERMETNQQLHSLNQYAREHRIPIIQDEGLAFLIHLIQMKRPKKVCEIGTAIGYSAIQMALAHPQTEIWTIERDEQMIHEAKHNIQLFNLEERIHLIEGDALLVNIEELAGPFDLIFIDAAKSQYRRFFERFEPLLAPDGIIVSDNLVFHNLIFQEESIQNRNTRSLVRKIKAYNEWLKQHPDFTTYFYPIGDGMATSIRK